MMIRKKNKGGTMSFHPCRGAAAHTGHGVMPKVGSARGRVTPGGRALQQSFEAGAGGAGFRPVHPPPPLFPPEQQQLAPPMPPPPPPPPPPPRFPNPQSPAYPGPGFLAYPPHIPQASEPRPGPAAQQLRPRPPYPGPPVPRSGFPCFTPTPNAGGAERGAGYQPLMAQAQAPLLPPQQAPFQPPYPLPYPQAYPLQHFGGAGYPQAAGAGGYPPGAGAVIHPGPGPGGYHNVPSPQQPPPGLGSGPPSEHFRDKPQRALPARASGGRHEAERDNRHKDRAYRNREQRRSPTQARPERRDSRDRPRERDRDRRVDSGRRRISHDRERTPSRHRGRGHSRDRHKHRDNYRSPSYERSHRRDRKRTHSRSSSRERKRPRWENERDRRSAGHSSSKDKSQSTTRSKEVEANPFPENIEEEKEEEELLNTKPVWIRCTHSENYYSSDPMDQVGDSTVVGTSKLRQLYAKFDEELGKRQEKARAARPPWEPPKTKLDEEPDDSSSDSGCDSDDNSSGSSTCSSDSEIIDVIEEIKRRKAHPDRLHEELWYNDPGQMNDGPLCKCSAKAKRTGIRHSIYPGEEPNEACRPMTNNAGKLFHYRITVSPPTNFLTDRPTVIEYDDHEYIFEGFSLFSHTPLNNIPLCRVIRFNIDYTIHFIEEMMPENFCVKGLGMFASFLFKDILELYDWNIHGPVFENGVPSCPRFHFLPRFVRSIPDSGKEVLSMHQVLLYLLRSSKPLVPEEEIANMLQWEELEWQKYAEECKGMIVTHPGMKPSSVRIDQLDREQFNPEVITFPIIVHFGIRPAQLSYAGDPQYQKLWKSYVKLRHLLANSPKVKQADKQKLAQREEALQKIRQKNTMRREVTVELSSQGFWKTGVRSDVCQHAMMLPVLTHHIRYHQCLMHLDKLIGYTFKERCLLQLAMTHPSHHLNFGMNPDHARNSLSNCGIRQPKYGDRKVHHMYMRKKGINTLINIMSRLGQDDPAPSRINHNERLEFLGDAVVEFLTSVHLYFLFPNLEEGGLATYRTAIVQNQHLAMLAKKLELDRFMLYAHGPDLCRESDLRHAMANCFEALIGAVYLEGGLEEGKHLFGRLLFNGSDLRDVWLNYPLHPLQLQESNTDRPLIATSPVLKKLTDFEETIGVNFIHIRLLARAFTLRTVGFNHLTLGHNQRMEFLGDSIMQLVATEYLFIHFPDHHEGHLTLLRSSLVNNRTQAKVAEELGMQDFAITNDKTKRPVALRTKTLADLLESFIAALYIDQDLDYVRTFMNVCFFPRLKEFILNQDWNDPKSQLQQCCLTLRTEGKEPDIPLYKILQTVGPSHARTYTVAVYFKGERIGCGTGPSIQQAEMGAAMDALEKYNFPQMAHQKRFIERKYRQELREMRREREQQEKDPSETEESRK
ncbi:ribonuclease 3 isoform X1 [Chiloscyllium punctatum]|uniref:ribonuclease 3 isoform X1 n=2 Tax=Chiloscyllium punctatum TaxID=137246 RepID=UPI003B636DEB